MRIFRSLWSAPGFAITAVAILALGIGANVACFTVVRAVLLKPLDYRDPDRLVILSDGASPAHLTQIQSSAHDYSAIGAFAMEEDLALTGRGTPEVVKANRISANSLQILGVSPLLGTGDITNENAVLISSDLWERRFNSDFHVVGQTINLAGIAYTISGVLRPGFAFPSAGLDVWLSRPEDSPRFSRESRALSPFLTVFGRLRPGITIRQATAELKVLQADYAKSHPAMLDAKPKLPTAAVPLQRAIVNTVQSELWLLFGTVLLVLLIACSNLAALLLARSAARSTEFSVRAALGASRAQIVKHLLSEILLLSLLGGGTGALLAFFSLSTIRRMAGSDLPRSGDIQFDAPVLLFAIAISLLTALLFGFAPSLSASRADLMAVLRSSQSSSGHFRVRGVLVAGQIALSVVLLISTTLLLQSILHLRGEALGFDPHNLLTARIVLPADANPLPFFENVLTRISSSPAVQHASVSLTVPMTSYPGTPVQNASLPPLPLNQRSIAAIFIVTPEYFQTLRIPLKAGRTFTAHDRSETRRVAVIDEGLARHLWPEYPARKNPVGEHIFVGGVNKAPAEVIGVVADVHQDLEGAGWGRSVYVPFAQSPTPSAMVAIRTEGNPMQIAGTLRRIVQSIDPAQPVSDVQPMEALVEAEFGTRRALMQVLAFFACVALVLALVGIYGLISYSVSQRTRELGVRRALGASQTTIVHMVIAQTLRLTMTGVALGAALAIAATRFLKSYLFHMSATDPATFIGVSVVFVAVAVCATLAPAYRAATVEPMRALRYE